MHCKSVLINSIWSISGCNSWSKCFHLFVCCWIWIGEEWGLYGSVDFNENRQNRQDYIDKIVTYINFDMSVTGYNIAFLANPLFRSLLFEASDQVNYPYDDHGFDKQQTLFQVWRELQQQDDFNPDENLRLVTTGSDYGAFEYYSGI